jgi:hypothetical protein
MASRALRISQATFDEAVADNIETFGMDRPTAIADAISQFEASGVDLSNIDTREGDRAEHPILSSLPLIRGYGAGEIDSAAALVALGKLTGEIQSNASSKPMATLNGGITFLSQLVLKARKDNDTSVLRAGLEAVRALVAGNDDAKKEVSLDVVNVTLALLRNTEGFSMELQRCVCIGCSAAVCL